MIEKNILLFRGTFDPVHTVHTSIIKDVLELMRINYKRLEMFNELWILPTFVDDKLKNRKDLIDGSHRINMLHLALTSFKVPLRRLRICSFELDTKNKAGLYKTISALHKCYPTYTFGVLMGMDCASHIRLLKHSRKFVREVRCVVKARYGYHSIHNAFGQLKWFSKKPHLYLAALPSNRNIFSGKIRKFLGNLSPGEFKRNERLHMDLLPEVGEYILDNNLYFGT